MPRLIKVFVLIWASEFETSEDRGPHLSKRLWIDNDKLATAESEQAMGMGIAHHADSSVIGQNADNCHVRSKAWITWRRILSSFVNLCDLTVTGFVPPTFALRMMRCPLLTRVVLRLVLCSTSGSCTSSGADTRAWTRRTSPTSGRR